MSCERIFSRSYVLHLISDTSGEIKVTRNPSGQVRYWSITSLSITQMISDGNPFTRRRYLLYVIFITESCMILILPEPVHEGWKAESICSNNSNNKVVRARGSQAVSHCLCCGRKDIRLVKCSATNSERLFSQTTTEKSNVQLGLRYAKKTAFKTDRVLK